MTSTVSTRSIVIFVTLLNISHWFMVFTFFFFKACKNCKTWTWNLPLRRSLITAFGPAFHLQTICQQSHEGQCEREGQGAEGAGGRDVGLDVTRPARVLHLFVRDGDVVRCDFRLRVADLSHQKAHGQESVSQWRLPRCDVLFLVGQMRNVSFPWLSFKDFGGPWQEIPELLPYKNYLLMGLFSSFHWISPNPDPALPHTDWKQMFYFYQSCSFPGSYCKQPL